MEEGRNPELGQGGGKSNGNTDTTLEKLKCIVKMMSPVGAREPVPLTELNLSIIRMGVSELRIYCYLEE